MNYLWLIIITVIFVLVIMIHDDSYLNDDNDYGDDDDDSFHYDIEVSLAFLWLSVLVSVGIMNSVQY